MIQPSVECMKWYIIGAGFAVHPEETEDGSITPLLMPVNDVFCPASDLEEVPDELIHEVYECMKSIGFYGLVAWVCLRRQALPWRMDSWKSLPTRISSVVSMFPQYAEVERKLIGRP